MARFKSVAQAKRSLKEYRQKISDLINEDLGDSDSIERTFEFWRVRYGKNPKYIEKKKALESLNQNVKDAEAHILFAQTTSISKDQF